MSCTEYSSPPYKLIAFFRDSRDSWEAVAKKRRTEIRDLKARVRDLATSRDLWKGKTKTALGQLEAKEDTLQSLKNAKNSKKNSSLCSFPEGI